MIAPLAGNSPLVLRSAIPVLAWTKLSPEEVAGMCLNQKVLTWKCAYKQEMPQPRDSLSSSQRKLGAEIGLPEILPREEHIHTRRGKWGSSWPKALPNAWFTDGSSHTICGQTAWTAGAFRPRDNGSSDPLVNLKMHDVQNS